MVHGTLADHLPGRHAAHLEGVGGSSEVASGGPVQGHGHHSSGQDRVGHCQQGCCLHHHAQSGEWGGGGVVGTLRVGVCDGDF